MFSGLQIVYIVTKDKHIFHAVSRMQHMQQHMRANFLHGLVQVHSTMFEITITCLENTFFVLYCAYQTRFLQI